MKKKRYLTWQSTDGNLREPFRPSRASVLFPRTAIHLDLAIYFLQSEHQTRYPRNTQSSLLPQLIFYHTFMTKASTELDRKRDSFTPLPISVLWKGTGRNFRKSTSLTSSFHLNATNIPGCTHGVHWENNSNAILLSRKITKWEYITIITVVAIYISFLINLAISLNIHAIMV